MSATCHALLNWTERNPSSTRPVWIYLDSAVSPQRVALGQDKWLQFRADIDAAQALRCGAGDLVAIWGVESN